MNLKLSRQANFKTHTYHLKRIIIHTQDTATGRQLEQKIETKHRYGSGQLHHLMIGDFSLTSTSWWRL